MIQIKFFLFGLDPAYRRSVSRYPQVQELIRLLQDKAAVLAIGYQRRFGFWLKIP